jgi:hypothetical protein
LVNEHGYVILNTFGAEYRGIVQYYLLAGNVRRLNRLLWVAQTSLLKTLARKPRFDGVENGGPPPGQK